MSITPRQDWPAIYILCHPVFYRAIFFSGLPTVVQTQLWRRLHLGCACPRASQPRQPPIPGLPGRPEKQHQIQIPYFFKSPNQYNSYVYIIFMTISAICQLNYCHLSLAVGCCELRLRSTPWYRLVCICFPTPGRGLPYGSCLGLSRCLGPGECLHSLPYNISVRYAHTDLGDNRSCGDW